MAMDYIPQFNILEIETGKIRGYRLSERPNIIDIYNKKIIDHIYYPSVCLSDEYIYLLYADRNFDESTKYSYEGNEIHIFDWNGNMVQRLDLGNNVRHITLDAKNNILYGMNDWDEVYSFDLSLMKKMNENLKKDIKKG